MSDELTHREKEAALLAASGLSNRQVGQQMRIEQTAVAQYLHRAYEKLGASGRGELAERLTMEGLESREIAGTQVSRR